MRNKLHFKIICDGKDYHIHPLIDGNLILRFHSSGLAPIAKEDFCQQGKLWLGKVLGCDDFGNCLPHQYFVKVSLDNEFVVWRDLQTAKVYKFDKTEYLQEVCKLQNISSTYIVEYVSNMLEHSQTSDGYGFCKAIIKENKLILHYSKNSQTRLYAIDWNENIKTTIQAVEKFIINNISGKSYIEHLRFRALVNSSDFSDDDYYCIELILTCHSQQEKKAVAVLRHIQHCYFYENMQTLKYTTNNIETAKYLDNIIFFHRNTSKEKTELILQQVRSRPIVMRILYNAIQLFPHLIPYYYATAVIQAVEKTPMTSNKHPSLSVFQHTFNIVRKMSKWSYPLNQYDDPYWFQAIEVASRCNTLSQKSITLLHFLVKNEVLTTKYLYNKLPHIPKHIKKIAISLCKTKNESEKDMLRRIAKHPTARKIKQLILENEIIEARLHGKKGKRYQTALDFLNNQIKTETQIRLSKKSAMKGN